MGKTDSTIASRNFNTSTGGGNVEQETASKFLLSRIEAAVRKTLVSAGSRQGTDSLGESGAFGNQPEFLGDYTWNNPVSAPVMSLPPSPVSRPRMATLHALQEWEGYVVDIEDDEFVARLVDLTAGDTYESDEAIIPMAEISDHDAANMEIGSIFRWVIGYEHSPEGTRKRVSQIVFRDLPRTTESDLRAGREWARKLASALNP